MDGNFSAEAGVPGENAERLRDELFDDGARRHSATPCLPAHPFQRRHEEKVADPGAKSEHVKARLFQESDQGLLREMVEVSRRIPMDPPSAEQFGLQAIDIGNRDDETSLSLEQFPDASKLLDRVR